MTAVTLVYTLATAAYVSLAVRVLGRRPLTSLHWSCAAVLVALAFWSIEDVVHGMTAAPKSLAWAFGCIGPVGWISFASVFLVFAMVLTRRLQLLRSWPVLLALFVPPVLFIYVQIAGEVTGHYALTGDYILTSYGWRTVWTKTLWVPFYYAYYMLYTLVSLLLILRRWKSARTYRERRQTGLILSTGLVTLVLGTITDVILPQVRYEGIPDLGAVVCLIWAGGLYFAVTRYGLMSVTPQDAASEILATMADALLLLTPEGNIAIANHGASDLLGRDDQELRGQQVDQFFAAPDEFRQALARVGEEVSLTALELECRDRNGRIIPVSASSRVMRDKAGETVGSVWVLRDITARREAEQRQAQLLAEVEGVNRELNSFAHVVSHDLKAPLRAIDSLLKWLVNDYGERFDADGREMVNLLLGRVKRMHDLIDGILQYSRAGRALEEVAEVDLSAVVPEVVGALAPPDHINVALDGRFPVVRASRVKLEQVFQNLLSNAIKYSDKPQGLIRVGCSDEGACWKFGVSDNGPGIADKDQERIFQLFQTLKPRDQSDSTGVGLAVVKKIVVEMYDGRVWVESKFGEGSTFYFTLPKTAATGKAEDEAGSV
jgi:PAS domain S-box-containing protein